MTLQMGDPFKCGHIKEEGNIYREVGKTSTGGRRNTEVCATCRRTKARARRNELKKDPAWLAKEAEASRQSRARRKPPTLPEPVAVLPKLGTWVTRALCGSRNAPDFFQEELPAGLGALTTEQRKARKLAENRAVNFCFSCPVMFECADHAVTNKIEWGVWGGLTESDRGFRHNNGKTW